MVDNQININCIPFEVKLIESNIYTTINLSSAYDLFKEFIAESIKQFTYENQLELFPDLKLEKARRQLREQFETGKIPNIYYIIK